MPQKDKRTAEEYLDAGEAVPADKARELIIAGKAPENMRVKGILQRTQYHSYGNTTRHSLDNLPKNMTVESLDLSETRTLERLPEGLRVEKRLTLKGCTNLVELPAGLDCYDLDVTGTALQTLPADLKVEYRLDLTGCTQLRELPPNLTVGTLILRGCTNLQALPEGLNVHFLDITGCIQLTEFPRTGSNIVGRVNATGCFRLKALPDWLTDVAQLNIRDCASLRSLPETLHVGSWIDLANTPITDLPESMSHTMLRWRDVAIEPRILFHPETITAEEVLAETNAERRRVLLDRMGYERFMQQAQAQILDSDFDPGGKRQLLRVPMQRDEDLVCLSVLCPSTGRQYIIRVPPTLRNCHHAAAWIAGFDNPDSYRPLKET